MASGTNHNAIAAITNIGSKPTNALLTLHYDGGKRKYEVQQTIAPGDQMWVNLAQLIHNRVPDRKGNVLPVDLKSVTYDLQDLTPGGHGLIANAMTLNSSLGAQAVPEFPRCCGQADGITWNPDAFFLIIDGTEFGSILGYDQCTGQQVDITGDFTSWWSDSSAVATVSTKQVHGVAAGFTNADASGLVEAGNGGYCTFVKRQAVAPVSVGIGITSIDPDIAMIGTNTVQITINGYGFGSSSTVNLPPGFTSSGLATFTVNGPNKMIVQQNGDVIGTSSYNPSAEARYVTYQVQDVGGTIASNIPIAESASDTGYNCTQSNPGYQFAQCNAKAHTDANGMFQDEWDMYTGYTPAGCGVNVVDDWQWCGPTGPNPNPGKTFGTLSGWIHTVDSQINGYTNPPHSMPGGFAVNP